MQAKANIKFAGAPDNREWPRLGKIAQRKETRMAEVRLATSPSIGAWPDPNMFSHSPDIIFALLAHFVELFLVAGTSCAAQLRWRQQNKSTKLSLAVQRCGSPSFTFKVLLPSRHSSLCPIRTLKGWLWQECCRGFFGVHSIHGHKRRLDLIGIPSFLISWLLSFTLPHSNSDDKAQTTPKFHFTNVFLYSFLSQGVAAPSNDLGCIRQPPTGSSSRMRTVRAQNLQRGRDAGQRPALKARSAATTNVVCALRPVENARSNIATQLNAVGKHALQARCAVIPAVESALLLVGSVLSNFANKVKTTLETGTKMIQSCSGMLTFMVMNFYFLVAGSFGRGKRLQLFGF
ncbi:hypothetical protein GX51_04658 [Blastomyces parvus]|uniref:Uncharacterized protein n=1 Tax=Blastomyces parvus TaxID=2060905 RepID=A0A2B7X0X0_9EURO|nr:hypothetical protein GX51_04658 [Blastomyces parvus]